MVIKKRDKYSSFLKNTFKKKQNLVNLFYKIII